MDITKSLSEEIKQSIEKNLPNQVGEVLKKRLEEADQDKVTIEKLNGVVKGLNKDLVKQQDTINDYRAKESRYQDLNQRENEIAERERQFKIDTLEYQLASEKEKTQSIKEVAMGLVRNTSYRKEVFGSNQVPYTDQYGNQQSRFQSDNKTETTSES